MPVCVCGFYFCIRVIRFHASTSLSFQLCRWIAVSGQGARNRPQRDVSGGAERAGGHFARARPGIGAAGKVPGRSQPQPVSWCGSCLGSSGRAAQLFQAQLQDFRAAWNVAEVASQNSPGPQHCCTGRSVQEVQSAEGCFLRRTPALQLQQLFRLKGRPVVLLHRACAWYSGPATTQRT